MKTVKACCPRCGTLLFDESFLEGELSLPRLSDPFACGECSWRGSFGSLTPAAPTDVQPAVYVLDYQI